MCVFNTIICVCTHVCMCVCVSMCICTYVNTYTGEKSRRQKEPDEKTRVYVFSYVHVCVCMCICTYAHIYTGEKSRRQKEPDEKKKLQKAALDDMQARKKAQKV
jgi:hypothetical protein